MKKTEKNWIKKIQNTIVNKKTRKNEIIRKLKEFDENQKDDYY